jgi:D-glycero-D-manno-heptose 1,7-bisphosphate phosphatase
MPRAAIFWDRDGTLIEDPGYLRDPDQVKLLPGAADALRRLASAGFQNIVATNQSGVARGMMDETTVEKIHLRLRELLAKQSAELDAVYYCPFLDGPEAVVERYRQDSDLRKPRPGMLLKASLERNIDLAASWSVGDNLRDAQAGRAAGCRTILINVNGEINAEEGRSDIDFVARSPAEAADIILRLTPGAQPAAPGPAPLSGPRPEQSGPVLQEILSILQRFDRRERTEDFSLARLGAAIIQMVAIGALIWAIFGLEADYGTQLVRLAYALFFQLMALALFMAGGRR